MLCLLSERSMNKINIQTVFDKKRSREIFSLKMSIETADMATCEAHLKPNEWHTFDVS